MKRPSAVRLLSGRQSLPMEAMEAIQLYFLWKPHCCSIETVPMKTSVLLLHVGSSLWQTALFAKRSRQHRKLENILYSLVKNISSQPRPRYQNLARLAISKKRSLVFFLRQSVKLHVWVSCVSSMCYLHVLTSRVNFMCAFHMWVSCTLWDD